MAIDLKKAAKLALGAGAAYMAVKDPKGALIVAGDLAGDATRQKEELIKQRGEQLAKEKEYYRQRADILFANKNAQYETDFAATKKLDDAMNSLVSASANQGASKENIALNILTAKGIIPNTGTDIEPNSGIDIQLRNEMNKIKDVIGEDGTVTGFTYEGSKLPVRPKYEQFFDASKFDIAQKSIEEGTVSTLGEKLFGQEDKTSEALTKLQSDMSSGYQAALESNVLGDKKTYNFKANASGTGEMLSPFGDTAKPVHPNLSTTDLSTLNSNWKNIQSKSTYGISTSVMGSVLPADKIKDIVIKNDKGDITVRPDGQALFDSINGLQVTVATKLYDIAKYDTGNLTDLNEADVKKHVTNEFIMRNIELDTDQPGYDFENPIKGFYVVDTNILPLGTSLPATIPIEGKEVNTKAYLQENLNAIAEKYEGKGETLKLAKPEMDAFVRNTLKPEKSTYEFTDNGVKEILPDGKELFKPWTDLSLAIARAGEEEIAKTTPSNVLGAYYDWVSKQQENRPSTKVEKEGGPPTIDNQVEELFTTNITKDNYLNFSPPKKINIGNTTKLNQEFIDWSNSDGAQSWIDFIQGYEIPEETQGENLRFYNLKIKPLQRKLENIIEKRNQVLGTE